MAPVRESIPLGAVLPGAGVPDLRELELRPGDRLLVLAPHPDDETIGAGGLIQAAVEAGVPVRVAILTDGGSSKDAFADLRGPLGTSAREALRLSAVRRREALAATGELGVAPGDVVFLGYPDSAMLPMWQQAWSDRPVQSPRTRATTVRHSFALTPGAAHTGESVLRDLGRLVSEFRPTVVAVSHPGDTHPDHEALSLFSLVALWDWTEASGVRPRIYSYVVHYWEYPRTKGLRPHLSLEPPAEFGNGVRWRESRLTAAQRKDKFDAISRHETQMALAPDFLHGFVRASEPFDVVPEVRIWPGATPQASSVTRPLRALTVTNQVEAAEVPYPDARIVDIATDGERLRFSVLMNRQPSAELRIETHVAGWAPKRFVDMPKLSLVTKGAVSSVLDRGARLGSSEVLVVSRGNRIDYEIPLVALGSPERVIVDAKLHSDGYPVDSMTWTAVELADSADR